LRNASIIRQMILTSCWAIKANDKIKFR